MTKQITKATVDTAVWGVNSEIELRDDYSGRGMYGDSCWAVVGNTAALVEFEENLAKAATMEDLNDPQMGPGGHEVETVIEVFIEKLDEIRGHRREDSMGMSHVWYYPKIELVD